MLICEYQIPMPVTVEEYGIGLLYMVAKSSMEDSGAASGTGVEFVKNEPYTDNEHQLPPGQFTEKVYFVRSYLPRFLAALLPESASSIVEFSWNAFPRCKTVYQCPYFGTKLSVSVDSIYLRDKTPRANALGLSKAELAQRSVISLDIASREFVALPAAAADDPTRFVSAKTNRGQLVASKWYTSHEPLMYAYKVVRLDFKKLGLQSKVEKWGQAFGFRNSFVRFNRRVLCWIDEWFGLSIEDIRAMEKRAAKVAHDKLNLTEQDAVHRQLSRVGSSASVTY